MEEGFDLDQINNRANEYAKLAIKFDNENKYEAALIYYKEAIELCITAHHLGADSQNIKKKMNDYLKRSELLKKFIENEKEKLAKKKKNLDEEELSILQAKFLMNEALEDDENNKSGNAYSLYMEAIEFCMKIKSSTNNEIRKKNLSKLIDYALERAEALKSVDTKNKVKNENIQLRGAFKSINLNDDIKNENQTTFNEQKLIVIGDPNYKKKELDVIKFTSKINNREFVPFLNIDLKERFGYLSSFTDKDGLLLLSDKQKKYFSRWLRFNQIAEEPKIIKYIDCFSIKQTIVTDCSFIASLTVAAQYEKKFKKKLVTSIIYPQNRLGEPCYNPCGKYMIKLHINGIFRKVIVDDLLPVDQYRDLLCSHSSNCDEFWISLLEKAYLKVMGGYNFPGSNSSIDLNALTGWIPDRIDLKNSSFEGEKTFLSLADKFRSGLVLITVATSDLSDDLSDRCGLVTNHAYALLNIRNVQGKTLLLLKNPWRNQRWKGNFSECDRANWTSELMKELNYDPNAAKTFDDGVFWIDYKSFSTFFSTVYLNWNPTLFKYTSCLHSFWSSSQGPIFDLFSYENNPQYKLSSSQQNTAIWVLLTRHITDKDDFANNKVYLAIVVFKGGEKIYVQNKAYIDGSRINSPHYLCKIPIDSDTKDYTLVVSQYEKTCTIYYSLRVYSLYPFTLNEIVTNFNYNKEVKGEWDNLNSGGCLMNESSYSLNPVYRLEILNSNETENNLLIQIKVPKKISVGIDLYNLTSTDTRQKNYFYKKTVDAFRYGINVLEIKMIGKGTYNLIPCTYEPEVEAPYILIIKSTSEFNLTKIK